MAEHMRLFITARASRNIKQRIKLEKNVECVRRQQMRLAGDGFRSIWRKSGNLETGKIQHLLSKSYYYYSDTKDVSSHSSH